ncbi:hypothetical protein ACF0H5_021016 [Mactra antiquata]
MSDGLETELPREWSIQCPPHSRQPDGQSCGIFILKLVYEGDTQLKFVWLQCHGSGWSSSYICIFVL